jgi:hypothetical protein
MTDPRIVSATELARWEIEARNGHRLPLDRALALFDHIGAVEERLGYLREQTAPTGQSERQRAASALVPARHVQVGDRSGTLVVRSVGWTTARGTNDARIEITWAKDGFSDEPVSLLYGPDSLIEITSPLDDAPHQTRAAALTDGERG